MTRDVEFFHLFFTFEMILEIVKHTNSYACEHIMEGSHRSYAQKDGSWKEVTSDEIKRLIALLFWSCQSWRQCRQVLEYQVALPRLVG